MPSIEILDILTINCNIIGTQECDRARKCSINTANGQDLGCEQHYTNMRQDADRLEECYRNTDSDSDLKSNIENKPMVNINEMNYFHW